MSDNIFFTKEFKDNLRKYEEAREAHTSVYLEPEDFTDIAEYYHLHGDLPGALEAIDAALCIFPGATEPLAFKARVSILIYHDVNEAMRYAEMIDDKNDLEYFYIIAEIMIADNRLDDAEAYLTAREKILDEDDTEDYCLDVATLFADYEAYDLAAEWLRKCEDTDCNDYIELKGRISMNNGKLQESLRIFNELIDRVPFNNGYWNLLASAQYLSNDLSGSLESSDYALAIDPDDADAILNKANCLMMLGNSKDAEKCYEHYQRLQPQSEIADMGIAAVNMNENQLEVALSHWKRAARLCSTQSANKLEIYRNMCLVFASLSQYKKSFQIVDELEKITGGATVDSLILKGYIYLLTQDTQTASSCFEKALEMTSNSEKDNTLYYIAYCFFDCNDMQTAHDILRKLAASSKSRDFTDFWAYLVRTDYELGLQEEFLADLKKATERNPIGIQRELSDVFPKGMPVREFYNYAVHHPFGKRGRLSDNN